MSLPFQEAEDQARAGRRQLDEAVERCAAALDLVPVAFCTLDRRGVILDSNAAAAALFGRPRAELVGAPLAAVVTLVDPFALERHLVRCFADAARTRTELSLAGTRGTVTVELTSAPVRGDDGAVVCCPSVLTDVTAWRSAELRWRLVGEATDALLAAPAPAAGLATVARLLVPELADVAFIDLQEDDGAVVRHAAQFVRHVAAGADTPQARVLASGEPLVLPRCDGETIARALSTDGRAQPRCPGGSLLVVPLVTRARPGPPLGAITCINAGSARRHGADDLALAERVGARIACALAHARELAAAARAIRGRDDLAAILAHDLRSPLQGIRLHCEQLLAAPAALSPANLRGLTSIERGVRVMERLVGDLLDAARFEAGQLPLRLGDCAVGPLALEAARLARPHAARKEIALEVAVGPPGERARCDRDRILQVLGNVLGNAIQFTPERGSVTLAVSRDGERVAFVVRDTGEGIAPAHLPHVFDRYWRAPSSQASGSGLGLYIAKTIVDAHGGEIGVTSEPGRGTAVRFTLARAAAAEP